MKELSNIRSLAFRPARRSDLEFLLALRNNTMNTYLTAMGMAIDEQAHLSRILVRFDAAKIVSLDQQPVALLKAYSDETYWHLIQIQVSPHYQGQGLGSQLVKKIMQQAKQEQKKVLLSVLKSNPAKILYQRLGFSVTDEGENDYQMSFTPDKSQGPS